MSASNGRDRDLRDDEVALWRGYAKSIKPLRAAVKRGADRAGTPAVTKPASPAKPKQPPIRVVTAPSVAKPAQKPAPALAMLDRRTKQKLARGREAIDARLDLHGMTQAEAFDALSRFLNRVQRDGAKFVIVVTGKGARGADGERGVLRRQVPQWLRLPEFRALIIGFESAHIGHGGEGALYVRVRRGR